MYLDIGEKFQTLFHVKFILFLKKMVDFAILNV